MGWMMVGPNAVKAFKHKVKCVNLYLEADQLQMRAKFSVVSYLSRSPASLPSHQLKLSNYLHG